MVRRLKTYGTFTREGTRRVAYSPAERVEMIFGGWSELQDAPKPTAAAPGASPTADPASAGPAPTETKKSDTKSK